MTAPLDLGKVIAGAFLVPWWRRKAFARALAIPVALMVALSAVFYYYAITQVPWYAALMTNVLYGLFFTLFAVTCHRLVLLDPESVAREPRLRWTRRETRFFLWVVAGWLVILALMLPLLTVVLGVWATASGSPGDGPEWVYGVAQLPLLYLLGRLCILFPATAVDRDPPADLRWAWRLTSGNGWRLLVIVGLLPWLLSWLVHFVHRSDATPLEWLLVSLLAMTLFAVEIAAVSISYRELTKKAG
ncbi:MAG: hypothetical protein ACREUN_09835 [Burkholderiales bacterium]